MSFGFRLVFSCGDFAACVASFTGSYTSGRRSSPHYFARADPHARGDSSEEASADSLEAWGRALGFAAQWARRVLDVLEGARDSFCGYAPALALQHLAPRQVHSTERESQTSSTALV